MRPATIRVLIAAALAGAMWTTAGGQVAVPSPAATPLTFAVIGDNGTGKMSQYDVARQMLRTHASVPFELVLMMGDNMYGSQQPRDFVDKFEIPYGPLLRMGIPFYAVLGNHDDPNNRNYPPFNMGGQRYYSLVRGNTRFFFLDTNLMDPKQLDWFDGALRASNESWQIVIFHHPIYSDGDRHGSNVSLRVVLEPLLVRYGVDVVFTGHEHIYERVKPQKGIAHFIVGSGGQLRKGGLTPSEMTAAGFDQDNAFLVATLSGASMSFQAISRTGVVVDSGMVNRRARTDRTEE